MSASSLFSTNYIGRPSFKPKHALGFRLQGPEYQNLRRLVRKCRLNLTAIDESETSMLDLILPYLLQWPPIYYALLALAGSSPRQDSSQYDYYQAALAALRTEMQTVQENPSDMSPYPKVLCSSYLLAIFSLHNCDSAWAQHARAMISIVSIADHSWLQSSKLGAFLMAACCHMDISAFAVGRTQRARQAWLSWMMRDRDNRVHGEFTTLETIVGYPESLLSLIALISESADDTAFESQLNEDSQGLSDSVGSSTAQLEHSLATWSPPDPPGRMSLPASWVLRTAWETIRRAAQVFLIRGAGFHSDLLIPLKGEAEIRKTKYVREIISNIGIICRMAKDENLSIGNAMLWPLVVAGCECALYTNDWDVEVLALLHTLETQYTMLHVAKVRQVMVSLWTARHDYTLSLVGISPAREVQRLSLEKMARQAQLVIPLL